MASRVGQTDRCNRLEIGLQQRHRSRNSYFRKKTVLRSQPTLGGPTSLFLHSFCEPPPDLYDVNQGQN